MLSLAEILALSEICVLVLTSHLHAGFEGPVVDESNMTNPLPSPVSLFPSFVLQFTAHWCISNLARVLLRGRQQQSLTWYVHSLQ